MNPEQRRTRRASTTTTSESTEKSDVYMGGMTSSWGGRSKAGFNTEFQRMNLDVQPMDIDELQ